MQLPGGKGIDASFFPFSSPTRLFALGNVDGSLGLRGRPAGIGGLVVFISRAPSYLSNAPETCINCHVMSDAYLSWQHSSHAHIAVCNDCHVPQDNLLKSYWFKAQDGFRHAAIFTFRWEPQVIRLSERSKPVVQANCRRCHQNLLEPLCLSYSETVCSERALRPAQKAVHEERFCWECHRRTPHEQVHSLSGAPGVFRPRLPPAIRWNQEPTISGRPIRSSLNEAVHPKQTQ